MKYNVISWLRACSAFRAVEGAECILNTPKGSVAGDLAAVAEDMAKRLWSTREYENLWVTSSDCRRREWGEIADVGLLDIRVPTEHGRLGLRVVGS